MKKFACLCIPLFLLLAAAGCRGGTAPPSKAGVPSDLSSSRASVSSGGVSSRPAASSNPVSSVPAVLSEPLGDLNLSFDPRVYVDTFFEDGYFNQNSEWVYWTENDGSTVRNSPAYIYRVAKGKHREYYYQLLQGEESIQYLKGTIQDAVQLFAVEEPSYTTSLHYSSVQEDGTVIYRGNDSDEFSVKVSEKVSQWEDVVFFIDYNKDAIGLKNDGTVLYEHYPRVGDPSDPDYWRLSQIFIPENFTDIVAIASQSSFPDTLENWEKDDFVYLLRKDGVLFNARGEVVYRGVERLFPAARGWKPSFALLDTGELIRLDDKQSMGFPKTPGSIVSVRQLQWGTYALMADGSFQTFAYDETDYWSREYQKIISQTTGCKTT